MALPEEQPDIKKQRDLVLSCLAVAESQPYQPVQIQKLVFLFEKRALSEKIFNFTPFDYGPFDPQVYHRLEELFAEGLVNIIGQPFAKERLYVLTPKGEEYAKRSLEQLSPRNREFLNRLSQWVRKLSFAELVGAIYKEYPDMREKSVFKE